MFVSTALFGLGVRSQADNPAVGFVADPNDLPDDPTTVALNQDELWYLDGINSYDADDDWDDDIEPVERAPRRAASGTPRDDAGPRSRTTSMAIGAGGLFADEPGGFASGASYVRGPTGRPRRLSAVSRSCVIELLEEAAGGLVLERMRRLMRPGRRTRAADDDYRRLASAIALLRSCRRVRVDNLAEVLDCDPATIWRLTIRGRAQLQDSRDPYVGTGAQQIAP